MFASSWFYYKNTGKRADLIPCLLDVFFTMTTISKVGTAVAQFLKCCATNRKVPVSIPAGVIGISHRHKILLIALWPWGSTQSLTEMSTRSISWGVKVASAYG